MPDDEVKKLIEMKNRFFVGSPSFGVNTLALVNELGESERTMIEYFPWTSLEHLQDSYGIYKDTLSNFSLNVWEKVCEGSVSAWFHYRFQRLILTTIKRRQV